MKYNKNSLYEKPLTEIPRRCEDCLFFEKGYHIDTCKANECRTTTYGFSDPSDRPLPQPLTCPWWYANSVWSKVRKERIEGYKEERLREFAFWLADAAGEFKTNNKRKLVTHIYRRGGGGIIDFNEFPYMEKYYLIAKENDRS